MDGSSEVLALRARYVFPVVGPPIDFGVISIRGGRIEAVGKSSSSHPPIDLGDVAILPGFVNVHTHLEFSGLQHPLGQSGESLPLWIRRVIDYRRHLQPNDSAIHKGIKECLSSGVTSVGEIASALNTEHSPTPTSTVFHEVICLDEKRFDQTLDKLNDRFLMTTRCANGISPHAPYSVHPRLLPQLVEIASSENLSVAMHLAESREEMELLRTGRGPFRDLLEELGVWRDEANPAGLRPLDYLRMLCEAPRSLVVHGNYFDDEEFAFLAEHADRMAVAFCPRTHAFFGHPSYPLSEMLFRGVRVCLGTDSRASNPDLNLLEEMKFVSRRHSDVSPHQILQMATVSGAPMMPGNEEFGQITPGARADLAVVSLPNRNTQDPYELILADESRVAQTWLGGQIVR